jgi:hypothetical protein
MDKPEQGFDLLQNAVNNVCGADEHWFDYAVQMGPYETFDYVKKIGSFLRKNFHKFSLIDTR